MLGVKARNFREHERVCLENFVPPNHFYRQLDRKLDVSFVRSLLKDKYCGWNGRPSLDPVVFFKLQLIMFFEDIRSERQLMEQVAVNLAFRWYIGYDLDEAVPHHSSLSKIRQRYGLKIFQQFFEKIVEHCIAAGLVWGKELYFDGTLVEANADYDKQSPRFYEQAKAHLGTLFEEEALTSTTHDLSLVHKYDGHQRMVKASGYQREADYWVNPTDPDAAPWGKAKWAIALIM
jgi:transposase